MRRRHRVAFCTIVIAGLVAVGVMYLQGHGNIQVLNTQGHIGDEERRLMYIALLLSLIVVVPVFTLLLVFAWRYRESNKKAKYSPELDQNGAAETIWWLIPSVLILILSVITWTSSHKLDPYKPLASTTKPLKIQVVSLDWKWLFIYPDQHIASVNEVRFPEKTPITFQITSDSVMNSFWIPQLGGQIYAMPGMQTELHLMADKTGQFAGSSANISGSGFAGMTFAAHSLSADDFTKWTQTVQKSASSLTDKTYALLATPSKNNPVTFYASADPHLYDTIMTKYMMPEGGSAMSNTHVHGTVE
jgi:cytochrome o ubiquinol oxidase subunit 2